MRTSGAVELTNPLSWLREPWFWLACGLALPVWLALAWFVPANPIGALDAPTRLIWLGVGLPIIEELAFRGFVQGQMLRMDWAREARGGVTLANGLTSIAFCALHLVNQPPAWALATFLPSLIFGWFRDRYQSVLPAIVLHVIYNTGFFLVLGMV
jgi:membrane protease YdiL (CAAX protease family)